MTTTLINNAENRSQVTVYCSSYPVKVLHYTVNVMYHLVKEHCSMRDFITDTRNGERAIRAYNRTIKEYETKGYIKTYANNDDL